MTVRKLVKDWLKEHGYDGLYTADCGCSIGDLVPCGEPCFMDCKPGYRVPCPSTCEGHGEHKFYIVGTKPKCPAK